MACLVDVDLVGTFVVVAFEPRRDLSTGQCILDLKEHKGPVIPIRFIPDGKSVLSGSYDRTIWSWDLDKGCSRSTLLGHSDVVVSIGFTPQSLPIIVSGSFDETIKVWNLETG